MAKYIEHLTLDISGKRNNIEIFAKQGDRNKRFLKITLVDEETQIMLEDNEKVEFRCLKPDKKYVYLAATKEPDGTIMVKLEHQVLTAVGKVRADVAIVDEQQDVLSSTNFYITVEPSATDSRYIPSTSYRKLDMEIDMDGNSIRNLPEPTDDGDAVSKFYVDEQIKENALTIDNKVTKGSSNPVSSEAVIEYVKSEEKTVDSALDENSKNAISNATVAKEFLNVKNIIDENKKKWYIMNALDFSQSRARLRTSITKIIRAENALSNRYSLRARFSMQPFIQERIGDESSIGIPLTDIPFECTDFNNNGCTWLNDNEFPTLGVIHPSLGTEPIDLVKEVRNLVDGNTFIASDYFIGFNGYTVGHYDFECKIDIDSYSEEAIDALMSEMKPLLSTITHFCLAYEKQEIIEAKAIGG